MKVLVGADPEFFLKDSKTGEYTSAHDLIPGTKEEPHLLPPYGAVQADGTALEFNIKPAETSKEFRQNITLTLSKIRKMVPKNFEFVFQPSVEYRKAYFDTLPDLTKALGCNPDFNAYSGRQNPPPNGNDTTMRTASGHIHIGWTQNASVDDKSHMWDCCEVVKSMDNYFEGLKTVWDTDRKRERLYGAKGAFRPKSYGCEYRVLSNAWLNHPKMWPWIFDSVQYVMCELERGLGVRKAYFYNDYDPIDLHNSWARPYFDREWLNG